MENVAGNNFQLTRFLGIPYAKPPVHELRFMKPQKMEPWNTTLEATQYSPSCYVIGNPSNSSGDTFLKYQPQPYSQSEDCLHLNIYYGGDFNAARQSQSKAVMVFIHGGSYTTGNQNGYDGSVLSYKQDVLYVTMNYRLGLFGFASTNDGLIPGNMGLFDQHAALVWIQENIGAFGGDQKKVTIFGESAGGDAVFNHLMSPMSNGLFSGAIIESTVKFSKPERAQQADIISGIVRSNWNCDTTLSVKLLQCLQGISAEQLNNPNQNDPFYQIYYQSLPIIDGEFLPDNPMVMMKEGRFNTSVSIMVGYNGADGDSLFNFVASTLSLPGSVLLSNGMHSSTAMGFMRSPIVLPFLLNTNKINNQDILLDIINREYFLKTTSQQDVAKRFLDLLTDAALGSIALDIANSIASHAGTGKVYLYKFDYRSVISFDYFNLYPQGIPSNVSILAGHGDELYFNLGKAYGNGREDEHISEAVMQCWADFARLEQPQFTSVDTHIPVVWEPYTENNQLMFHIQAPISELSVKPVPQAINDIMDLWNSLLPEINSLSTSCDSAKIETTTTVTLPNGTGGTVSLEDDRILNLSMRMTDIWLIVCAVGLIFMILVAVALLCCLINECRKRNTYGIST